MARAPPLQGAVFGHEEASTYELPLISRDPDQDHGPRDSESTFETDWKPDDQDSAAYVTDNIDGSGHEPQRSSGTWSKNVLRGRFRPNRERRFGGFRWRYVFSGWSLIIILGNLFFLGLTYGFFGAVARQKQIPLTNSGAEFLKTSPHLSAFIITGIATILSTASTFLFSRAIIYLLTSRLNRPTSLFHMSSAIELSRGQFVFRLHHLKWTFTTVVCGLMLNTLTASFVTLFTPTPIVLTAPIVGTELDLGSKSLSKLMADTWTFTNDAGVGSIRSTSGSVLGPVVGASGKARAGAKFGELGIINFNGASWNVSTGGTLPHGPQGLGVGIVSNATGLDFAGGPIPARYSIQGNLSQPSGFSSNYSITQQGFTADVTCRQQDVEDPHRPSLKGSYSEMLYPDFDPVLHFNYTLQKWMWQTWCPDGNFSYSAIMMTISEQDIPNGGLVPGNLCAFQDRSGNHKHDTQVLVLQGVGPAYSFINSTVCEVTPRLTTVRVDYGAFINASETTEVHPLSEDSSTLAFYTVHAMMGRFTTTQNLVRNGLGDDVVSVYFGRPESVNGTMEERQALLNGILEDYIKGTTEFIGSFLRAGYSANGSFPNNQLPSNMTTNITGTWRVETMGWDTAHHSNAAALMLLPVTFVSFVSLAVVILAALTRDAKDGRQWIDDKGVGPERETEFNLGNPLHLIMAASTPSLAQAFVERKTSNGDALSHAETIKVRLCPAERGLVSDNMGAIRA